MLLLMSVFCITLFASCGSEAYKECKKSYSEFEKRLKKATTEEEMVKATECYIGEGNLKLMTNNEQYKIDKWFVELSDLWEEKFVFFCPGTYSYSSCGNSYKLVIDADDDAYNGHATLFKNGTLVSNRGEWSRKSSDFWPFSIRVEFPNDSFEEDDWWSGIGRRRYYDIIINVLEKNCRMLPGIYSHESAYDCWSWCGTYPCEKQKN